MMMIEVGLFFPIISLKLRDDMIGKPTRIPVYYRRPRVIARHEFHCHSNDGIPVIFWTVGHVVSEV